MTARTLGWCGSLGLLMLGCAYQDVRLSYPELASIERPIMVLGEVAADAHAYSGEIALGRALRALADQAKALGADDVADVRTSVDTRLGLLCVLAIPACHAEAHGKAIRYSQGLKQGGDR
ncbi:MAG: hypothetical protein U1E76_28160 [Planctomycetota bacterium]